MFVCKRIHAEFEQENSWEMGELQSQSGGEGYYIVYVSFIIPLPDMLLVPINMK